MTRRILVLSMAAGRDRRAGERVEACLRRIEQQNGELNAMITVLAAEARREAQNPRPGPLSGMPVALKDLFDTAGVRTTSGSGRDKDRVPQRDAEAVRRLKAAGAILVGKANMDEFAYNFTSETSYFGAARNPWDRKLSPGGSSGGSAIAVASGMAWAALGSDTGGSIRLPAALCGVTGFKPTYGLIPTEGATVLAWTLDHVGPLARSAADAALVTRALSGKALAHGPVKSARIGVPRSPFWEELDPEVEAACGEAAALLGKLGAGVSDVSLPALRPSPEAPELPDAYARVIYAEAYAYHAEALREHRGRYHPATLSTLELGAGMKAADYIAARQELEEHRRDSGRLFEKASLLVTPTSPAPAFALGSNPPLAFLRNTAPWNLYGLPTVSIPCGFTRAGLPVGLQITGPRDGDGLVLAMAEAYQKATDWHRRTPPGA